MNGMTQTSRAQRQAEVLQRILPLLAPDAIRMEPAILVPAGMVLDLAGEAVHSRLMFVQAAHAQISFVQPSANSSGHDARTHDEGFCLRPDLTIPVALAEIAQLLNETIDNAAVNMKRQPCAIYYAGPAFRLKPSDQTPDEFIQCGQEVFFGAGDLAEDQAVLSLALRSAKAAGVEAVHLHISDQALTRCFIEQMDLSPDWRERFLRRLGRPKALLDLISAARRVLAQADLQAEQSTALAVTDPRSQSFQSLARAGAGDPPAKAPIFADRILAGRRWDEIQTRLARAQSLPPSAESLDRLAQLFRVVGSPETALNEIHRLADGLAISIGAPLNRLRNLVRYVRNLPSDIADRVQDITFHAQIGGNFDYYDGFLFRLDRADPADPTRSISIGGGGRYDHLLGRLSQGRIEGRAIGFSLRTDRLGKDTR